MKQMKKEWVDALFANSGHVVPTKADLKTGAFIEMRGLAGSSSGFTVRFDSYLLLHDGHQNHTLTLALKVHLNPMLSHLLPANLRAAIYNPGPPPQFFLHKPWQPAELAKFAKEFKQECARWNDQLWLIPPDDFSMLDVKVGKRTVRPNVYCHLYVEVVNSPANAHLTVDVINLDKQDLRTRLGVADKDMNTNVFRSNAGLYHSLDVKAGPMSTQDETGEWNTVKHFSTIMHEIGHAIGLPHIGVTHKDFQCQIAMLVDPGYVNTPSWMPALYQGGSNGRACYGHAAPRNRGENVMGGGTTVDESNAAPWASRLALHTRTKAEAWKVSTKQVPPKVL